MKLDKSTKLLVLLFFGLMIFGYIIHIKGYTFQVVDQLYCRKQLPWITVNTLDDCTYRSGDDIFEYDFAMSEMLYLSGNPYQQEYSERVMNGYPVSDAYATSNFSLSLFLSRFLPTTSSIVFSSLVWLFVNFVLGFRIGKLLGLDDLFSSVMGVLSLVPAYVSLSEPWNLTLIAYGFLILGILYYYKKESFWKFLAYVFIGASLTIISSIYQFYLYIIINIFFLFGLFLIDKNRRKISIMMGCLVGIFGFITILFSSHIYGHLSFLSVSNKLNNNVSTLEYFSKKGLSLDPLGWTGTELIIMHKKILGKLLSQDQLIFLQPFQSGAYSPGPLYLVLVFFGCILLWRKGKVEKLYILILCFWLLYFSGPLQIILSFIGGPFRSETSVRASYLFFLLSSFVALYATVEILHERCQLPKYVRFFGYGFLLYTSVISFLFIVAMIVKNSVFSESPFLFISAILGLIGINLLLEKNNFFTIEPVKKKNIARIFLIIGLCLPTVSRLFFGVVPAVFNLNRASLYYPDTEFSEKLDKNNGLERVALVQFLGKEEIHPNLPVNVNLKSIGGYRNPIFSKYLDLYLYHKLIFEGSNDPEHNFQEISTKIDYIDNTLEPFNILENNVTISPQTEQYFQMHQVNTIIGSDGLTIINKDWKKLFDANQLTVWKWDKKVSDYFFATNTIVISDSLKRLEKVFQVDEFDPNKDVILENEVSALNKIQESSEVQIKISLLEQTDGFRRFFVDSYYSGVLTIPVTFSSKWQATFYPENDSSFILETVQSNYAFLGVILPKGKGVVKIMYKD